MKLYTEEQMHTVMLLALGRYQIHSNKEVLKENQDLIDSLTPIELPSDEEIWEAGNNEELNSKQYAFVRGAKWMQEKIQGGNK